MKKDDENTIERENKEKEEVSIENIIEIEKEEAYV